MNKMFRTAAVITALFVRLGIFYCSSQPNHELFGHSLDPIRVITFWLLTIVSTFFLQLSQAYGGFLHERLAALQFPQGKEARGLGLEGPSVAGALGLWDNSIESSFSAFLAALR